MQASFKFPDEPVQPGPSAARLAAEALFAPRPVAPVEGDSPEVVVRRKRALDRPGEGSHRDAGDVPTDEGRAPERGSRVFRVAPAAVETSASPESVRANASNEVTPSDPSLTVPSVVARRPRRPRTKPAVTIRPDHLQMSLDTQDSASPETPAADAANPPGADSDSLGQHAQQRISAASDWIEHSSATPSSGPTTRPRRTRRPARANVLQAEATAAAVNAAPVDLRALRLLMKRTPYEQLRARIASLARRAEVLRAKERQAALKWMRQAVQDYGLKATELGLD